MCKYMNLYIFIPFLEFANKQLLNGFILCIHLSSSVCGGCFQESMDTQAPYI